MARHDAASGFAVLLVANLALAGGYTFVAACDGHVAVWHLLLVRGAVYVVGLGPWALRHGGVRLGAGHRRRLALRGVTGTTFQALMTYALGALPLATATLLAKTAPLWTVLLVWLLFGIVPLGADVLAIFVAVAGVAVILHPEGTQALATLSTLGLVAAVGAAVANSCEFVVIRRLRRTVDANTINVFYGLVTFAVSLPFAPFGAWPTSARVWLYVVGYGVCSLIGQTLLALDLRRVTATTAAALALTVPVWAVLLGWVLFSQTLSALELCGVALVLAGGWIVARSETRRHGVEPALRWRRMRVTGTSVEVAGAEGSGDAQ